jgi:hypothetical protein
LLEQVSGRDRFGVRREIALGEAWILKLEATSGRALVVKVGSAKGCPKRDIHPEGTMIAIQSFVKFKVPTAGVEETMRDPDTVDRPLAPGRGRGIVAEPV